MGTVSGILLVAIVGALFLWYRPKWEESVMLGIFCLMMGVITPMVGAATWFVQVVSLGTKMVAFVCCWIQFSRERRHRDADLAKARRAAQKRHPAARI